MNRHRRDRVILWVAVVVVLGTASLVLAAVLQAERDGTQALQQLQTAQVEQLTRSMDSRVKSIFDSLQGIAGAPPAWHATLRDASDAKRLRDLQAFNPKARAGSLIVDRSGVVTNGTLLRDPTQIGRKLDHEGLDQVFAGKSAFLPVGPGVTTVLPVIDVVFPLKNAAGAIVGGFVIESDLSVDSAFNAEVGQLKRGRTGEFSFVDSNNVVIASSNPGLLGRKLDEPLIAHGETGFRRGHGRVAVAEPVPSAGWRTVFRQDAKEFEGRLTGPLHSALVYVLLAGVLAAAVSFSLLGRRLRRAREEQRRLEEISAAREEFISIVSHELRTPVAGLLGFLQTTLDHWDVMADDERRRAINRSLASARRLHSLTRDVLDTSSVEAGSMPYSFAVVDLRDEVGTGIQAQRDITPDRLISLTLPDDPVWVRCDPDRLQQVLTNLLDNALKSSPPLSPLEIDVTTAGDVVRLTVRDHGPGLSDAELGRVFDKFVRGRTSTTTGTGLGLYICRQLVEAQGGHIAAESTSGEGARFVVELPLVPAPAEPVGR